MVRHKDYSNPTLGGLGIVIGLLGARFFWPGMVVGIVMFFWGLFGGARQWAARKEAEHAAQELERNPLLERSVALAPFAEAAAIGKKLLGRAERLAGQPIPEDFWREWVAWYSAIMMSNLSGMLGASALEPFYSYSGPEQARHREKPAGLMDALLPEVRDRVGMVLARADELDLELIPEPVRPCQVAPMRGTGTLSLGGSGLLTSVPPDARELERLHREGRLIQSEDVAVLMNASDRCRRLPEELIQKCQQWKHDVLAALSPWPEHQASFRSVNILSGEAPPIAPLGEGVVLYGPDTLFTSADLTKAMERLGGIIGQIQQEHS